MRYLFGLLCVCVLGVMPLVGCSDATGDGGSGGTAGSGGSGGDGLVTFILRPTEVTADGSVAPLVGVMVCEVTSDTCTESNEAGTAILRVPADQELTITMKKEGYGSWVTGAVSDENRELTTIRRMFTHAQLEAVAADLGTPYPWRGGIVGLVRYPPHVGVTFSPVGDTADAVGDSFYLDAMTEAYSADLEATTAHSESWLAPLGDGGFTDVTPGEQVFEIGGAAGDCQRSWAWPGDTPNTIRVPVLEGYRTYGSWRC